MLNLCFWEVLSHGGLNLTGMDHDDILIVLLGKGTYFPKWAYPRALECELIDALGTKKAYIKRQDNVVTFSRLKRQGLQQNIQNVVRSSCNYCVLCLHVR